MADLPLSLDETTRILAWANEHTSSLRRHISWLKALDGTPLPGAEVAIPEIEKDIRLNLDLMSRLYEHRSDLRDEAPSDAPSTTSAPPHSSKSEV